MIRFLRSLYLHKRFFIAIFTLATAFLFSYWIPVLYPIVWIVSVLFLLIFLCDCIALFKKDAITGSRNLPEKFSNSDENPVVVSVKNNFTFDIFAEVIDEIPVQFQKRDFLRKLKIPAKKTVSFEYYLRPVERGEYFFGNLNIYSSTKLKLVKKKKFLSERTNGKGLSFFHTDEEI